ncbi:Xaa-Pro dipeptidase [Ferrimonas pelagia]|uniref:Xaa-Pro dipeptidase n=1 Tax=Ferrimonas pelagia TaxID=1177826 RepID=A0ABP9F828_9GAMM
MERLAPLYAQHIHTLRQRTDRLLVQHQCPGLVIDSGQALPIFLDDLDYPFKVNPHFKHWVPLVDTPHCFLIVKPGEKPTLLFYRPVDFWHKVPPVPNAFWTEQVELVVYERLEQLAELIPAGYSYIGAHPERAAALSVGETNPKGLIDALHFGRSIKSDYEIACLREANRLATLGHVAAKQAFLAGESEFAIQQAYLSASLHGENDVPYGNIVALNEHAAILHYTQLGRRAPAQSRSFLIDAGAGFHGYAADITRTYAFEPNGGFAELVAAMDQQQQAIKAQIRPGIRYTELHLQMHQRVAELLLQFRLAQGSVEALIASGITQAFFPHGLGHPIGLQVHDVAGFMDDESGTHVAPPAGVTLRCTRMLEAGMVLTIEPGLYVIDSLLKALPASAQAMLLPEQIDWLRPYGGIRIEDGVVVLAEGIDDLTRCQRWDD